MGLIGAQGSAAAQAADSEREGGEKDGHQPWSSDGGHADQIEFQALLALRSLYGLQGNAKHSEDRATSAATLRLDSRMKFTV